MKLFGTDESHSIFSVLKAAHSNGKGILGFFTTNEAKNIRILNKEALFEVTSFSWNDNPKLDMQNAKKWWKSFPHAKRLTLQTNAKGKDLYKELRPVDLPFEGLKELTVYNYNIRKYPSTLKSLINPYEYGSYLNLTYDEMKSIGNEPYPQLETLIQNAIIKPLPKSLKKLSSSGHFGHVPDFKNVELTYLDLTWNHGVHLSTINTQFLTTLNISHTLITDAELEQVPISLKHLEIAYTRIGDRGIRRFKSLNYLDVSGCFVTYDGVREIIHSNMKLKAKDCSYPVQLLAKILS